MKESIVALWDSLGVMDSLKTMVFCYSGGILMAVSAGRWRELSFCWRKDGRNDREWEEPATNSSLIC